MNIFFLHEELETCAQYHCDKHVLKMILEATQMLCNAHHLTINSDIDYSTLPQPLYKKTHENHPMSIWVRGQKPYIATAGYARCLCKEYRWRYMKTHKALSLIEWLNDPDHLPMFVISESPVPLCMPDEYKLVNDPNPITSYRNYYKYKATQMKMRWSGRPIPPFMRETMREQDEIHKNQ